MKKYIAPDMELIKYDVEDCLSTSEEISKELEDIGGILDDLV